MASGNVVISYGYRLRSSGPFPTVGGLVTHTFMAEKRKYYQYESSPTITKSIQMKGLVGGTYEQAQWTGLNFLSNGQMRFSGEEIILENPALEESAMPGSC
jgi:hypothetical protein